MSISFIATVPFHDTLKALKALFWAFELIPSHPILKRWKIPLNYKFYSKKINHCYFELKLHTFRCTSRDQLLPAAAVAAFAMVAALLGMVPV